MSFDQYTRGRLQKLVNACRALLSDDFSIQLQQVYGLDPKTGEVTPMARLTHLDDRQRHTAQVLRQVLGHYLGADADDTEHRIAVIDRMVREQAFTVLNRMAALLMMEARGQLFESVSKAYQSRGFQSYARLAGTALGETGQAYQAYLFSLFDELAQELQGLFDRFAANGLLFPRETALRALLDELNHPDITPLWAEDETIGWIYQYFNSKEERKAMREASQAPRNSRELAVRNQFFTPRYVVEFLVDNTLGRLWYQATQGTTAVKGRCQYLLCTPRDVFLRRFNADDLRSGSVAALVQARQWSELPAFDTSEAGVQAMIEFAHCINTYDRHPNDTWGDYFLRIEAALRAQRFEDLSTQELWDGVFLVCRADRHVGDGSVYQEPWFVAACQAIVGRLTTDDVQQKANVIAHHAVRDPRTLKLLDPACGSMHFGLYAFDLFAEIYREAWAWEQQHGPGSLDVSTQPQASLQPLSQTYADEESFLRDVPRLIIEHNIYGVDIDPRAAQIASLALWLRAQRAWHEAGVKAKDRPLIGHGHVVAAIAPPAERELRQQFAASLDPRDAELFEKTLQLLKGLPELGVLLEVERELPSLIRQVYVGKGTGLFAQEERADWLAAEARLRQALTDFAHAAKSTYQGRLFAQDALQGLRVIDLCREKFDVVVMNPPFGQPTPFAQRILKDRSSDGWKDIYAGFFEAAIRLAGDHGFVGAITSSQYFHTRQMAKLREDFVKNGRPRVIVDLGSDVLDDAAVQTALAILGGRRSASEMFYADLLDESDKETVIRGLVDSGSMSRLLLSDLEAIPGRPFCLHASARILHQWRVDSVLDPSTATVATGNHTFDDERFLRLRHEVDGAKCNDEWVVFDKGGEYQPFLNSTPLLLHWKKNGAELRSLNISAYGSDAQVMQGSKHWGRFGLCYNHVSLGFSPRVLPAKGIFSSESIGIFLNELDDEESLRRRYLGLLGFMASTAAQELVHVFGRYRKIENRAVSGMPISFERLNPYVAELIRYAQEGIDLCWSLESMDETSPHFILPDYLAINRLGLKSREDAAADFVVLFQKIDRICDECLGVSEGDITAPRREALISQFAAFRGGSSDTDPQQDLLMWAVGVCFGRFDLRLATGEREAPPQSDPFDPLPVRSPGMLPEGTQPFATHPGILVDDPSNAHDLARIVGEVLLRIDVPEPEGVRRWLGRDFFPFHLQRYSESRRRAPIYWPLGTMSGSYTLWVYYPNLTSQTLYTAINDFVEPKLKQVGEDVTELRNKGSARTRDDEKKFESLQAFEFELIELRDTLLNLAPSYQPNHDDGIQITAAPLWSLFRHKPWQKLLKETWTQLQKGDYDWAHLAMNYWPDRVREKCKTDKSLAIAHGLEDLYVEPEAAPKKARGRKKKEDAE